MWSIRLACSNTFMLYCFISVCSISIILFSIHLEILSYENQVIVTNAYWSINLQKRMHMRFRLPCRFECILKILNINKIEMNWKKNTQRLAVFFGFEYTWSFLHTKSLDFSLCRGMWNHGLEAPYWTYLRKIEFAAVAKTCFSPLKPYSSQNCVILVLTQLLELNFVI